MTIDAPIKLNKFDLFWETKLVNHDSKKYEEKNKKRILIIGTI
jgi:hypothetical protein